jgi:hypothetical protein
MHLSPCRCIRKAEQETKEELIFSRELRDALKKDAVIFSHCGKLPDKQFPLRLLG